MRACVRVRVRAREDLSALLASIELLMVEMANYFLSPSDFTQEIPLAYLPVFPMAFPL
jgi:hypothetical protein